MTAMGIAEASKREEQLISTGRVVLEQCCRLLRIHEAADWETRGMPDWLAAFKAELEAER